MFFISLSKHGHLQLDSGSCKCLYHLCHLGQCHHLKSLQLQCFWMCDMKEINYMTLVGQVTLKILPSLLLTCKMLENSL